jgi:hypothetical protein
MSSPSAPASFQVRKGFPVDEKSKHVGIFIPYSFASRRHCLHAISRVILSVLATLAILLLFTTHGTLVTVNAPTLFKPTTYETVPGFFAQSLNSTDDETFDFVLTQFTPSTNDRQNRISDFWMTMARLTTPVIGGFAFNRESTSLMQMPT